MPEENPPIREAIELNKHWANRLIAAIAFWYEQSLLEKEGLGGQAQMIYIDPLGMVQTSSLL